MNADGGQTTTEFDKLSPLYEQIKRRLLADIEAGRLAEGDFLPPEPELCAAFGVSRITLRRAVSELCDAGLLVRQQGRGTVVAPRKLRQALISLSGFSDVMDELGKTIEHQILDHQHSVTEPDVSTALGHETLTPLTQFIRLIDVDGRPMTLEILYLHAERFAAVFDEVASGGSFFQALRAEYQVEPSAVESLLEVGFPNPEERRHLRISPSQPVYRIEKTVFGPDGDAISWSRLVTPTNLVAYSVRSGIQRS